MASRSASSSSVTTSRYVGSPPHRETYWVTVWPFVSTTSPGPGLLATSSSPVGITLAVGRSYTSTASSPVDFSSPRSDGRSRWPGSYRCWPSATSSPTGATFSPPATASNTSSRSPRTSTCSTMTTASAPSGRSLPVWTRLARFAPTASATSRTTGDRSLAPNVSSALTAKPSIAARA